MYTDNEDPSTKLIGSNNRKKTLFATHFEIL